MNNNPYTYLDFVDTIVNFIYKIRLGIIIAFFVGAVGGYIVYKNSSPVYSSKLVAYSNNLTSERVQEIFDDFNSLISERSFNKLANNFQITEQEASQIINFKVTLTNKLIVDAVTEDINKLFLFALEIETSNPDLFLKIESKLPTVIESNAYVKKKQNIFYSALKANITAIDEEIKYLRSLKETLKSTIEKGNLSNSGTTLDLSNISKEIINFEEKRQYAISQLELNKTDLIILKEFHPSIKKVRPKLGRSLASGVLLAEVAFLFGYFTWMYINYRSKKV